MINRFYLLATLFFLLSLPGGTQAAQASEDAGERWLIPNTSPMLSLPPFNPTSNVAPQDSPTSQTFSIDLLPRILHVRSSYREKHEPLAEMSNGGEEMLQRHLNLLATFSYFGDRMVGEGELAYGSVDSAQTRCACIDTPKMMRLALKDHWASFNYGLSYRSWSKGFINLTGEKTDQDRDETRFWGDRNLGPFNVHGSLGESRDKTTIDNQLRLTRTATTGLMFRRPQWGVGLVSAFSLIEDGSSRQETTVLSHALTSHYQPIGELTLGPSLTLKDEQDQMTGVRTETPRAAFNMIYTPSRTGVRFTSSTAYGRSFSINGPTDVSTVNATAGIEWKLGKVRAADQVLSFNLGYNRQVDFTLPSNSREDFSAKLQLKIFGF
ncbi:MAG TPA: hypothetical protein VFU31_18510 [Candidatus Binatia bacterium]|nr:hypothetical protein [Candidatus Binatia bacterium]